jgi:hypothetical protein
MKTLNHWREKLKKTSEDGKNFHSCGSVESTLWKWLYYQSNLHVQCNPYQNSNNILHRNRKINGEIHMETQKISNGQSNCEQKSPMLEASQYLTSNYTSEPWQ